MAASITLAILSFSYGAPLIVVVGLKPIAASLQTDRSVVALAASLVWLGTGLGGILMGRIADRIGMRQVAIFGAVMTALGLAARLHGHANVAPFALQESPFFRQLGDGDQALRDKVEALATHGQLGIFAKGLFLVGKKVGTRDLAFHNYRAACAFPGNYVGGFTAGAALLGKNYSTTISGA